MEFFREFEEEFRVLTAMFIREREGEPGLFFPLGFGTGYLLTDEEHGQRLRRKILVLFVAGMIMEVLLYFVFEELLVLMAGLAMIGIAGIFFLKSQARDLMEFTGEVPELDIDELEIEHKSLKTLQQERGFSILVFTGATYYMIEGQGLVIVVAIVVMIGSFSRLVSTHKKIRLKKQKEQTA
ncbi:hypothetical protein ACFL3H_08195 [Gemmatimonadota bacterium]